MSHLRGIMSHLKRTVVALAVLALPYPALAQDQQVQVRGFGGWAFGNSDTNPYLTGIGGSQSEFQNVEFALNLGANPTDRLTINAQGFWETTHDGENVHLDYAAAQWTFSDPARLRVGRSTFPFGIYSEIQAVGTLRPFVTLPQSVYGPTGLAGEAYQGVGLTGFFGTSSGWEFAYDVYGGGVTLEAEHPFEEAGDLHAAVEAAHAAEEGGEHVEEGEFEELRNLLGGRLVISTPIEGLSFGASFYGGEPHETHEAGTPGWGDHKSWGTQLEYATGPWSLRSEFAVHREAGFFNQDGVYVELARRVGEHWQLAARYDRSVVDYQEELPDSALSLLKHEELAFGVNYWFSPELVLKASYHRVDGNLFAHDETTLHESFEGGLDERTKLFVFGAQFSF